MDNSQKFVAGTVCTLTATDRGRQELEWADLHTLATTSDQLVNGVESTFSVDLQDQLEDLVTREKKCCGTWLELRLTNDTDTVRLVATTSNAEGVPLIWALAGFAT